MTKSLLEDRRTLWVITALIVLLFAIGNLPWQLDDYDQAKQAFTSFEMIKEGHWLYQQTPHERVATKPPLVGWISAGLFGITRSWEVARRLPSLLAAIALAILLFRVANSAYGSIAGLVALGAFGLNLLSPRLATLVRTDMPLAFVIFLIGLLIWQKIQRQHEWTPRKQGGMRGPKVESEARTFDERDGPVMADIVGERRIRVEPGEAHQPVRPRGDVGLAPRSIPPRRDGEAGKRDQRRGQYSTSFRCTPLRSISYSSPWMGGRLGYQCTPRMAAGPATGRISCWTSS